MRSLLQNARSEVHPKFGIFVASEGVFFGVRESCNDQFAATMPTTVPISAIALVLPFSSPFNYAGPVGGQVDLTRC
jgi:hypothetical protein